MIRNDEEETKTVNDRSIAWTDTSGNTYMFYRKPLLKVCSFILLQETCERLAFYGLQPTLKGFLRDKYGFTDTDSNSFVLLYSGLIYVFSLFSAIIADTYLGIYNTILVFSAIYMGGLVLVDISAIDTVNQVWMVYLSLYGLLSIGAGGIKSCVSVLGGQQYSPVYHKDSITTFFTLFYASINVGALIGGFVVPALVKEVSYFVAYLVPAIAFAAATIVLMMGSKRYVLMKPQGSVVLTIFKVIGRSVRVGSLSKLRQSNGGQYEDHFIDDVRALLSLTPFFALAIPFQICYNQIFSGFESQSVKMYSDLFGWDMPHTWMTNIDPIAVIIGSLVIDSFIFPFLRRKNMMPSVMMRFCIGFIMSVAANLCAMGVEFMILDSAEKTVSIWWQVPQFSFIAFGEIFVISTSYEVAFTKSPDSLKAVASAFNLVCFAVAGFISTLLVKLCEPWFEANHADYYYGMLAGMCGVFAIVSFVLNKYFEKVFARAEEQKKQSLMRVSKANELDVTSDDISASQ
jgi:peptide/histidine transporter 3/4